MNILFFLTPKSEVAYIYAEESLRQALEKMEFHKRVYEGFCKIAEKEPCRVVRLDASGAKEQTHEKIVKLLIERGIIPSENNA